jgi:3-oxosteroid 1-dehydrogenase
MNQFAKQGKDDDFGRGDSLIDRYYCDHRNKPHANLGQIIKPPFYAIQVWPGDLGTKGGIKTNAFAQALTAQGDVLEGLYAAGNASASVMGNSYPGAGSTIGPAMTFAYLAAKTAAAS